jgi:hypothetical protein
MTVLARAQADIDSGDLGSARRRLASHIGSAGYQIPNRRSPEIPNRDPQPRVICEGSSKPADRRTTAAESSDSP